MNQALTSLDIEDLSAKQLRKILNGIARSQLPYSKKSKEEKDSDAEEADEENDSLVELHREKKGDSKPPKVLDSDLPASDDEDEDEDDEPKNKKAKA
jgi:hypothetical protein